MKLEKEKSVYDYKKEEESVDILTELSKEELIERYLFRFGIAVKRIKILVIVLLVLVLLLLMSLYVNLEYYYFISYLIENGMV